MHKIAVSAVLAITLVFPISAINISSADAKMQPSGRPDVSLTISISYVNEERFQAFYADMGKVDRIFETVILPMINDFVKKHEKDLYERYTDEISIAYSRETNDVSIWFTQYPEGMGETIKISPQSLVTLEVVDMINVGFPVGYYSSIEYLLPNTSVRVGYLSNHMQELLEKYTDDIVKGPFHVISSFMLDDISKTTLYFDNRRISESETEIKLALDNPVSAYSVPEFSTNTPISIVKSSNHRLTVSCASPGDIAKMTLTLSYPSGEKVDMKPTLVERQGYKGIEFALQDDEPEGLYKFVLNDAEPKKIVYCHARVNVGNDYPFEYIERPQSETITVHDVFLLNDSYNPISLPLLHSNVVVRMSLTNDSDYEHEFVYILLIKNSQGITEFISLTNETMPARSVGGFNSELWCVNNPDVYSAKIYIWDDLDNPSPLSNPYSMGGIGINPEGVREEGC